MLLSKLRTAKINYLKNKKLICFLYNGGQKISSTTVIPLTYAVKQHLGTNNLTSHVDMCQSNCVCVLIGTVINFNISNFNLQTSIIMTIKVKLHAIFVK
jgi:hypothetical protein